MVSAYPPAEWAGIDEKKRAAVIASQSESHLTGLTFHKNGGIRTIRELQVTAKSGPEAMDADGGAMRICNPGRGKSDIN
jgi:hypothetical protein